MMSPRCQMSIGSPFCQQLGQTPQWKCDTAGDISDFCPAISGSSFLHMHLLLDLLLLYATANPQRYGSESICTQGPFTIFTVCKSMCLQKSCSGWSAVNTKSLQLCRPLASSREGKVSSLVVLTPSCLCTVTHRMWAGHTAGAVGSFVNEKLSGEAFFLLICKYLSSA